MIPVVFDSLSRSTLIKFFTTVLSSRPSKKSSNCFKMTQLNLSIFPNFHETPMWYSVKGFLQYVILSLIGK